MTQPRPKTPSTVSTTRELAPSSQCVAYSVMNHNDALHTISPKDLAVGRVSAVCHGAFLLASFTPNRLATIQSASRVMRAIGFCHRLLQSRAPVPRSLPMRSRLPRARCFRSRVWRPLEGVSSRRRTIEEPRVFTTQSPLQRAVGLRSISSLERGGVFFLRFVRHRQSFCRACRATRVAPA